MTHSIFGGKTQLIWLALGAYFASWFFWKGILLFSVITFTPSVILEYDLRKAGWRRISRTLSFVSAFLVSAAIYYQIRAYF